MLEDNDSKTVKQHDSLPVIQQTVLPAIPLKFQCSQCGACCRRAGLAGFMEDRGDGGCIYLTEENMCSIYDTRPELCNMEKMWVKRNKELDLELRGITKKDYFIENSQACNQMMKQDNVDKRFHIDLTKYNEMEEKMPENNENQEKINGFEHEFKEKEEKKEKSELCCYHCEDVLVLTSIISLNNQVNFRCYNDECRSSGFISRGTLYQSEPLADN